MGWTLQKLPRSCTEKPGWGQCHHPGSCCLHPYLSICGFGFCLPSKARAAVLCASGGLAPCSVDLAPEPIPILPPLRHAQPEARLPVRAVWWDPSSEGAVTGRSCCLQPPPAPAPSPGPPSTGGHRPCVLLGSALLGLAELG